ncbi:glycosyltransferase [Bacillus cereus]|uniref:Glycosyl transferase family 1 domain-containing protein n=1 Tax=Bacillus cereus VD184 TaxID=1053242 RepID=A0A9W5R5U0_BACCE|nr:glycosyltransferase [Bacillus cereus]EOQ11104.1 hypothetical protein IKC_05703 [Bacillus cereus VD184]
MKKVAILTSVHYVYDTRIFYRISQSLVKHGYDVKLVAPMDNTTSFIKDGIHVSPVKKQKNRLQRIIITTWHVFRKALQIDADIYHFHDPELIFVGYLLQLRGKSVVFDIHENVSKQILTKSWLPLKKTISIIYRLIERVFVRNFHLILAEESYNHLYPNHRKKITVLNFPNLSILPDEFTKKKKNSIVYVGGVTRERGIETVLHALAKVKESGYSFHFTCIGPMSTQYKLTLQQLCIDLNIHDRVSFLGRLKAEDAYSFVKQAQIGVAILQPIDNYIESYPTKIFEYMALRTPYITSNFKLYSTLTADTNAGVTVNPLNTDEIKKKIILLLSDDKLLRTLSENGRIAVETKYNWEKEEKKLLDLYQQF